MAKVAEKDATVMGGEPSALGVGSVSAPLDQLPAVAG